MSQREGLLKRIKHEWEHTAENLMHEPQLIGNPADAWLEAEPNPLLPHPRRPDHDTLRLRRHQAKKPAKGTHRVSRSHLTDSLHARA